MSLRVRLILIIVSLVSVTSLIIGGASVLAMNSYFAQRLDAQVDAAVQRSQTDVERGGRPGVVASARPGPARSTPGFLFASGQAPGTLAALIVDGRVRGAAVMDDAGSGQQLPAGLDEALLDIPADGAPRTVDLGADLGDYRVAAVTVDGRARVVTGLTQQDADDAVTYVILVIAVAALIGLVSAALIGAWVVKATLRPLQRVADTATTVADAPLSSGEVRLVQRVPDHDVDRHTEVGQVGTALNYLLEQVEHALTQREASQQRMRQFVADASHELRTPLASILGYTELIRRSPRQLPPDTDHALGRVESQAQRMTRLVEDLLLLAQLDADPHIERRDIDLRPLVAEAVSDAQITGTSHVWSLRMPHTPVLVSADAGRLRQSVDNLLRNAYRHTPEGTTITVGITVDLASVDETSGASQGTWGTSDRDGGSVADEVVLTVHDDGPGIPAEVLPVVFERFARGDSSRSPAAGSTGLGLAIVAGIVKAHGGRVSVRSEPGSTTVRLALARVAPAVAH